MPVGVGAAGFVGVAPEATAGTYVAPTKYMVLRDESLKHQQATVFRRPLQAIADVAGAIPGNFFVGGTITMEITEDTLCHWLRGARYTGVKTGAGPFTYTFTPNALAIPAKTLSITVVRNGITFGYVGCIIGSQKYSIDAGELIGTFDILGTSEATQSLPTATYVTTAPFGAGQYALEIPTASVITDADGWELTINDNATAEYRLQTTAAANFIRFGERSTELSLMRDFLARTDYDAFKALTAQTQKMLASKSASASVQFDLYASIKDTYEIQGMSGQAELIRASIKYIGAYDSGTSASHKITVVTNESIASFP